jgi:medium-chain acyl-[acyl-carrier-protein] hydrolase
MRTNWFLPLSESSDPRVRLLAFPYAGGGAAVYRDWRRHLPNWIETRAVQLPGRGWRLREQPIADLGRLAELAAAAILPLADLPVALFGHSLGAWLALEVARRLEAAGAIPACLFVSGRQAPSVGALHPPMSHLSDEEFIHEIQIRYGGIPPEILASPEVLALLLPALRADVAALESYAYRGGRPIECPIVALGGESDPIVPVEYLSPWAMETLGGFEVETFPGGHFYFQNRAAPLLGALEASLEHAMGAVGAAGFGVR